MGARGIAYHPAARMRLWRLNGLLRAWGMCGEGARVWHRWMVGICGVMEGWTDG